MALGARSEDVVRQVVRQASGLIVIGTTIGLAGALAATRVLSSALYGVEPYDPQTYLAIVMILVAAACWPVIFPRGVPDNRSVDHVTCGLTQSLIGRRRTIDKPRTGMTRIIKIRALLSSSHSLCSPRQAPTA
jgi:hypothetical protein